MIVYTPPRAPKTIPVVDLEGGNVPWEIHKACRETGFFYVSNHGVPQALIDAQFEWAGRFFDLPLEDKLAIHMEKSPTTAGHEPVCRPGPSGAHAGARGPRGGGATHTPSGTIAAAGTPTPRGGNASGPPAAGGPS